MATISLEEFYRKVEKSNAADIVFVENPYGEGGMFKILETLGAGEGGYHFLARERKKLVVLRMGYVKDDFEKKLKSVMMIMGDLYKKYFLELHDSSISIKHFLIGKEKFIFDTNVFLSTWEPAEATLRDKLAESFDKKVQWFIQFLKGLSVIHERGRMHLDIKLDNLFIVDDQLKIGDFEFYFKKDDFLKSNVLICGTPGHIAPEMFYDRDNVSTKSDIFSAGAAFCELFTGSKPDVDLIFENNGLSKREQEDIQNLFGDHCLTIINEEVKKFFIRNFRIFNFFRQELNKKLESGKIAGVEHTVYKLLLEMMEINPEKRVDINTLLFKINELVFDPESLIGQELDNGRYKVQELIDAGGRGCVFKVLDQTEEVVKAIKLFPPQFNFIKQGFEEIKNELIMAREITHRNVVNVYGLERDGDLNFIVMEYIKGFTLKKKLDSAPGKKLKEPEALAIMRQVASGLMEAHRNKVIHRNLKDKNIMIKAEDNSVKIINFGLSLKIKQAISETSGEELLGSASMLFATPELFEQILNAESTQTDVWGFGAILYQMLIGRAPFDEEDKVRDPATLPHITGVSDKTRTVLMKCLEKDREKRYRNMQEVYDALFGEVEPGKNYPTRFASSKKPGIISMISNIFKKFTKKLVLILFLGLLTSAAPGPRYYPILSTSSLDTMRWENDANITDVDTGGKNRARAEILVSGVKRAEN